MSATGSLRVLARAAARAALPMRAGAGQPVKWAMKPDKKLPLWYDLWWDNGVFPGQPIVDGMFGPLPGNLTVTWYLKWWGFVVLPISFLYWYYHCTITIFDYPYVPKQYPEEYRKVMAEGDNGRLEGTSFDYSKPSFEDDMKRLTKKVWWSL